ncbi:MAG: hypothetical protein ACR2PG_18765 [Hyphomicrobiaceae bacterium]
MRCVHSDATSGLVANPLAGDLACWLVGQGRHAGRQAGRQAVFCETLEWIGTEPILSERAAAPTVAEAILQAMERRQETAHIAGQDVQANYPGPQNHDGGITTLKEKSLGAIAKGGEQPVVGLLGQYRHGRARRRANRRRCRCCARWQDDLREHRSHGMRYDSGNCQWCTDLA